MNQQHRWTINFDPVARKNFAALATAEQRRIVKFLEERLAVADEPYKFGKALAGKLTGLWRFRVGDCRIIAAIEKKRLVILVIDIDHRSEIYR